MTTLDALSGRVYGIYQGRGKTVDANGRQMQPVKKYYLIHDPLQRQDFPFVNDAYSSLELIADCFIPASAFHAWKEESRHTGKELHLSFAYDGFPLAERFIYHRHGKAVTHIPHPRRLTAEEQGVFQQCIMKKLGVGVSP